LFTGIWLGNQQAFDIHAAALSVGRIQGMLHIDVCAGAALALRFCDDVLADGRFSGRFRAVNFGDAAAGDAADTQGNIQGECPCGNDFHSQVLGFAQAHDCAISEALGYVAQGFIQSDLAV
jgi:hypothetical protein